jgi:hypothetical protein
MREISRFRARPQHISSGRSFAGTNGTFPIRRAWVIVEPFAHDKLDDNLNPIGRVYYAASAMLCTPASLSQEVALGLGAQAIPCWGGGLRKLSFPRPLSDR